MTDPKPIILVLGPTAGGKTEVALELARRLPGAPGSPGGPGGECVCADSMQIYRGMDIGTAKPTAAQRAEIPHHLLDLLDPVQDGFSVDTWLRMANDAIEAIRRRDRYPIVVGGTNLYVQAMLDGLFDGPEPHESLRRELEATDAALLRRRLEAVDPPAAQRIHPNDRKRTIRAVEVFELTGRRISDLQQQWLGGSPRRDLVIIVLDYSVEVINRRINARVREMIGAGLLDEVRGLGRMGRQASEALGYRQLIEHLQGRASLDDAVEQIKIKTRRLAKHQRTWLRRWRTHPRSFWIPADGIRPQDVVEKSLPAILGHPGPVGPFESHCSRGSGVSE